MVLQVNQCENRLYDKQTEADPDKRRRIGKMLATPVVRHQSLELSNETALNIQVGQPWNGKLWFLIAPNFRSLSGYLF